MTIQITTYNYWELIDEANQNGENVSRSNNSDIILKYPQQFGEGYLRYIPLRSGITLEIFEAEYREHLRIKNHPHQSWLEFVFKLSGNSVYVDGTQGKSKQDYIVGGIHPEGTWQRCAGKTLDVCVHIEPETLRNLIEGYSESVPPDLKRAIEGSPEQPILRPGIITPEKQAILHQILNCPYQGLKKKMYLEGNILELMALKLGSGLSDDGKPSQSPMLRPQDVDCIRHAREILIRNLNNPPSLIDLARQVGLNERKLKHGFHQVFGTTAFGLVHEYRMEQAYQLLQNRQMTISGVATAIGYASPTSFTAAFKRKFGISPKAYQLLNRRA